MALMKCRECGREISDTAEMCPHCGVKTAYGRSRDASKSQNQSGKPMGAIVSLVVGVLMTIYAVSGINEYSFLGKNFFFSGEMWKYDDDASILLMSLIFGIVLLAVGFVWLLVSADSGTSEDYRSVDVHHQEAVRLVDLTYNDIPEEMLKFGTCEMCRSNRYTAVCKIPKYESDFNLCLGCINKYKANVKGLPERKAESRKVFNDVPAEDDANRGICEMCGNKAMVSECKIPTMVGERMLCPQCIRRYHATVNK